MRIFTSFVLGLGGIVTTILILNQNKLFENQNKRIEQQTHLIEADRRSAQVFIMGDVLSDINKELEDKSNNDRILSNSLLGRVVSLSRAMKPYRYLENDKLIKTTLSPERGQLLISLLESKIDSTFLVENILLSSDFKNSELISSRLPKSIFVTANLMNANLSFGVFYDSYFNDCNLIYSNLHYANLRGAKLNKAGLYGANMKKAFLQGTSFIRADLSKANISYAEFSSKTDFSYTKLDSTIVRRSDWITYVKDSINVIGGDNIFKNYTVEKLNNNSEKEFVLVKKNNDDFQF